MPKKGGLLRRRLALAAPDSLLPALRWMGRVVGLIRVRVAEYKGAEALPVLYLRNRISSASLLGDGPVVSLTSFGDRTATVYLAIESVGRGRVRPKEIILWLSQKDNARPEPTLQRLVARGLTVAVAEDYGPHTKYYPLVSDPSRLSGVFVTADDDSLYPPSWLHLLVEAHKRKPEVIYAYRARHMAQGNGGALPYRYWELCACGRASVLHVATGVSGVLYPVRMWTELAAAGTRFVGVAPTADDLWLHRVALSAGVETQQVGAQAAEFYRIRQVQRRGGLWRVNNMGHANDTQIAALHGMSSPV